MFFTTGFHCFWVGNMNILKEAILLLCLSFIFPEAQGISISIHVPKAWEITSGPCGRLNNGHPSMFMSLYEVTKGIMRDSAYFCPQIQNISVW